MRHFDILLHSGKTVFRYDDIAILLHMSDRNTIKSLIQRAVKVNLLEKIANGIYALQQHDHLEVAASLRKQSYISLETVLQRAGVIFQDYTGVVTLVSDNTLEKTVGEREIQFSKIKNSILLDPIGINYQHTYMIASPERALCDRLYLTPLYHFDHLSGLDLDQLRKISKIYPKSTQKIIQQLIQHATNPQT